MARLSVNVNKVATLRNSRGSNVPSVVEAVRVAVEAGAPGITVHPRADERHIRRNDVFEVAEALAGLRDRVESYGGTLVVDSAPGRGTRIVLRCGVNA